MAMKRKSRKPRFHSVISRSQAVRLKPRGAESVTPANAAEAPKDLPNDLPNELLDNAALPESAASGVMLVITIASLLFIGFIAWCVSQMPAK
jgi:hypothetical protein